jgi:hypothetical protein
MKRTTTLALALAVCGFALVAGCQESHAPARVEVPQRPGEGQRFERDEVKPLPRQDRGERTSAPAPFDDVPLVTQSPPEQQAYVRAYKEVGAPRIVVAVNRGAMPDVDAARQGKGGSDGVGLRSIDTEAIENVMTDWFAADGQVDILSPLAQGKPLTDKQRDDLQAGHGNAVARDLGGDVLVQVSCRITEQAGQDLQLRMVAEAVNVGDGRSIGRSMVDVPAPLDKPKINKYTRWMARKLMDGMILSWQRMAKEEAPAANPGAPFRPDAEPRLQPPPTPRIDSAPHGPAVAPPSPAPKAPSGDAPAEDVPVAPGTEKN